MWAVRVIIIADALRVKMITNNSSGQIAVTWDSFAIVCAEEDDQSFVICLKRGFWCDDWCLLSPVRETIGRGLWLVPPLMGYQRTITDACRDGDKMGHFPGMTRLCFGCAFIIQLIYFNCFQLHVHLIGFLLQLQAALLFFLCVGRVIDDLCRRTFCVWLRSFRDSKQISIYKCINFN